MNIKNAENIRDIFSIFHDGDITSFRHKEGTITLEVEISYLAQRVNPTFSKFFVSLHGAKNIRFEPWLVDTESDPIIDPSCIFEPHLEILEAELENEYIQVVCNQHSQEFDYFGGELYLQVTSAEVTDEAGKSYSIEELDALCKGYWDEWADKNKA
jgi:hypothetical protein